MPTLHKLNIKKQSEKTKKQAQSFWLQLIHINNKNTQKFQGKCKKKAEVKTSAKFIVHLLTCIPFMVNNLQQGILYINKLSTDTKFFQ
jgi:hypothetical protein